MHIVPRPETARFQLHDDRTGQLYSTCPIQQQFFECRLRSIHFRKFTYGPPLGRTNENDAAAAVQVLRIANACGLIQE
jgi:hypothetical protein